ncbi:MAG: PIG-L family deacetylase [bacterium]
MSMYKILLISLCVFFVSGELLLGSLFKVRQEKVLVFAPHPDDDIIGCGGSIAKHRKNGHEVSVVYMTSGDAGDPSQFSKKEAARIREQEAINAEQILGVKKMYFLRNHDGALKYDQKNLNKLIDLIRQEQPDIVYVPHCTEAHKDHVVTYKLVVEAVRIAAQEVKKKYSGVKTIFCYEVWTPLQKVSHSEDISKFMTLKLQALRQHISQLAIRKYDAGVKGLNRYRGVMNGRGKYCEAFHVIHRGK